LPRDLDEGHCRRGWRRPGPGALLLPNQGRPAGGRHRARLRAGHPGLGSGRVELEWAAARGRRPDALCPAGVRARQAGVEELPQVMDPDFDADAAIDALSEMAIVFATATPTRSAGEG